MSLWNATTQFLPRNRDRVQFIVAGRKAWMFGTFENDCFRSRWASYDLSEVILWRKPEDAVECEAPRATLDRQYWQEQRMRAP